MPEHRSEWARTQVVWRHGAWRALQVHDGEPYGLDIARWMLWREVAGQARLLARRFGDEETAETIADLVGSIEQAETIEDARQLEASAAALYFAAWSGRLETAPRFATQDRRGVPAHWSVFETRRSVLASANSNRKAERPVNACSTTASGCWRQKRSSRARRSASIPGLASSTTTPRAASRWRWT